MNEHLASGEYLYSNSFRVLIVAWLNASPKSWVGVQLNATAGELRVERFVS